MLVSHMLVFNFSSCENKFMDIIKLSKLSNYLRSERGRAGALARHLGVSESYLSQMLAGHRPMPPEMGPKVELFTGGSVSRLDCRPADGHQIWPELKEASHA